MKKVTLLDKTFRLMIPHEEIMTYIDKVASQVNEYYRDREEKPILLCTMTGALPFTAELMRRLEFDAMICGIKVSSYSGTTSTGQVKVVSEPNLSLEGHDVLILEDIVDTGLTLEGLRRLLKEKNVRDVKLATLLFKPDKFKRQQEISGPMKDPEFVGKEIPNAFIVGFGLDYDEYGRCLSDIYVLDE